MLVVSSPVYYDRGPFEAPHAPVHRSPVRGSLSLSSPADCLPVVPKHGEHQPRELAAAEEGQEKGAAAADQVQREPQQTDRPERAGHRVPAGARSGQQGQPGLHLRLLRVQQVSRGQPPSLLPWKRGVVRDLCPLLQVPVQLWRRDPEADAGTQVRRSPVAAAAPAAPTDLLAPPTG